MRSVCELGRNEKAYVNVDFPDTIRRIARLSRSVVNFDHRQFLERGSALAGQSSFNGVRVREW